MLQRSLLTFLTALLLATPAWAQIDTDRVITIGRNAMFFKDYVLAIQYFSTAIRVAPQRAEPYYYRAAAKFQLDDYFGTEADCDSCIQRNRYIYRAYFLRALARQSLGKDSLALQDYQVVLHDNPDDQGALHNAALLYIQQQDTIAARHVLNRLQRFYPNYAPAYVIDGGLSLQQKDTVQAIHLFEKGLTLNPSSVAPYLSLANIAYERKAYSKAEEYLNNALQKEPENAQLYTFRGLVNYKNNNLRGAMQDYSTAINIDPNNLNALYNRALLRTQVGAYDPAVQDFSHVLLYDPSNAFARYNRALLDNQQGRPERAVSDLDSIIARYPSFYPAYLERAKAKRALGKTHEANQDLYKAYAMWENPSARPKKNANNKTETDNKEESKGTREERDKNIQKFQLLVADNSTKGYADMYRENSPIRGRVQDQKVNISPEPLYTLTYYTSNELGLTALPHQYVDTLALPNLPYLAELSSHVPTLVAPIAQTHQQRVQQEVESKASWSYLMDLMTLRDIDKAITIAEQLLQADTVAASIHFALGCCHVWKYNTARANQEQPTKTEALVQRKQLDDARTHFEAVLKKHPQYFPALFNLAYIYYLKGDYQTAEELLSQCLTLRTDRGEVYYNRALCNYALGKKNMGDKDMSTAGALGLYKAYSVIKRMQ